MMSKQSNLQEINQEIRERKQYLHTIESEIELASESGAAALRDLSIEVNALEKEKARLMKQLLVLKQEIQEAKNCENDLVSI